MRKLLSFMVVTLDGYYEGPDGEFDWPNVDDEFNEFAISQLNDIDTLLFGRATYEGMASYWPTPAAQEGDPLVAGFMNRVPKIVFSTTLRSAEWENTTLVSGDVAATISELKKKAAECEEKANQASEPEAAKLREEALIYREWIAALRSGKWHS